VDVPDRDAASITAALRAYVDAVTDFAKPQQQMNRKELLLTGGRCASLRGPPFARIAASNPPVDEASDDARNCRDDELELASIAQSDHEDRQGYSDDGAERQVGKQVADAERLANSDDEQSWDQERSSNQKHNERNSPDRVRHV